MMSVLRRVACRRLPQTQQTRGAKTRRPKKAPVYPLLTEENVKRLRGAWDLHSEYGELKKRAALEIRKIEMKLRDDFAPLAAKRREALLGLLEDVPRRAPRPDEDEADVEIEEGWTLEVMETALKNATPAPTDFGFFWRDVIGRIRLSDAPNAEEIGAVLELSPKDFLVLGYLLDVRLHTVPVDDEFEDHIRLELEFREDAPVEPKLIKATFVRDSENQVMKKTYDVVPPLFFGFDDDDVHEEPISPSHKRHRKFVQVPTKTKKPPAAAAKKKTPTCPSFFTVFQHIDDFYGQDAVSTPNGELDMELIDERNFITAVVQDLDRIVPDAIEVFLNKHLEHYDELNDDPNHHLGPPPDD